MRINSHTHIFNFKSVFTQQTLQVLLNRIDDGAWPPFVRNAVQKTLEQLVTGKYLDEETLLRQLVGQLSLAKGIEGYVDKVGKVIPADVSLLLKGNVDGLAVEALRELLRKLGDLIVDNHDAENQTLSDLVEYLVLGIQPTIDEVARRLMDLSGPDTLVVALTMDCTRGGKADEKQFLKQLEDTSQAALAFPGRLLPFVAVNTLREAHFADMEMALNQRGFVGVKLYPSLGYGINNAAMLKVLGYCATNEVPVLVHCSRDGFYLDKAHIGNSAPELWEPILKQYPTLKVCFGHFGGGENLIGSKIPPVCWTETIITLMEQYEGVYADIAYHTQPMAGGEVEKNYFTNMAALLGQDKVGGRILFGSDFFMVRQRLREDNLWRYFEAKFDKEPFRRITQDNPMRFLGLPSEDGSGAARNVTKYLDFLVARKDAVGAVPAKWAMSAIRRRVGGDVVFHCNPWGVRWTQNNSAHYYAWRFFRTTMKKEHLLLPFAEAGGLLVRQLLGWPSEQVSEEIRAGRLREITGAMHVFFTGGNVMATAEPGVDATKAKKTLRGLLANGDARLAEFGEPVDRLYHFKQEDR